ncbi:hypothetical protein [Microtetraspora sp. NBRC 16547]|uniref:hypothetical protein n=1 Tax=Microtetraspora sp. NBRC 16547 TaxID=3030993 RepID=UPI0025527A91|nr:hypothetical protein [Microtetraspora sp. NBRC 16547]
MGTAALLAPVIAAPAQAQAQARPTDPVTALTKQFQVKRGVHATSAAKINIGGSVAFKVRSEGDLQFGRSGVVASDITTKNDFGDLFEEDESLKGINKPTRTITINKTAYVSGGIYDELIPSGKSWLRAPGSSPTSFGGGQFIDVFDTSSLRAVLATTKAKGNGGTVDGTRTTVYRGAITLKQLSASSPAMKQQLKGMDAKTGKTVLNWKLWVGSDQLIRRVTAAATFTIKSKKMSIDMDMTSDTKFTKWGSKVSITAPPASEVATASEIEGPMPEMPTVITPGMMAGKL